MIFSPFELSVKKAAKDLESCWGDSNRKGNSFNFISPISGGDKNHKVGGGSGVKNGGGSGGGWVGVVGSVVVVGWENKDEYHTKKRYKYLYVLFEKGQGLIWEIILSRLSAWTPRGKNRTHIVDLTAANGCHPSSVHKSVCLLTVGKAKGADQYMNLSMCGGYLPELFLGAYSYI